MRRALPPIEVRVDVDFGEGYVVDAVVILAEGAAPVVEVEDVYHSGERIEDDGRARKRAEADETVREEAFRLAMERLRGFVLTEVYAMAPMTAAEATARREAA